MTENSQISVPTESFQVPTESSLTAPEDRNKEVKLSREAFESLKATPPLTNSQTTQAVSELSHKNFPRVERRFIDPPMDLQQIGLFSFVPAKGATPNERGIYGFAKIRGVYAGENGANERAEFLIKNVDSYHQIYHVRVGHPFPVTTTSDFSEDIKRVEINKELKDANTEDIRKKREKEQKDIDEIKEREKALLADVEKKEVISDHYTTLRVKKAQLSWTFAETEKKLHQMAGLIAKARKEIEDIDKTNPELQHEYRDKYMEARRQAGFTEERDKADASFMKYLVEDIRLPAVDVEYDRLYGVANK